MTVHRGQCQCGEIVFEVTGPSHSNTICHCTSCQKSAGAHAIAWAMFLRSDVKVIKGTPAHYNSSAGTKRSFCTVCGTSLFCEADYIADHIDITIATFDDPNAFPPSSHIWTSNQTDWTGTAHTLPKHEGWPPVD